MYRSVLCLIGFVGLCGVVPARLEASAATWFFFQHATFDGQPIDPGLIDVQGGPGFPLGTALDITTMAGPGHYEFAVRFIVANRGFQRIGQWSLSLEADSAITLQSYQPTGPFLIPLGPLNTLPATGPGLVLDSAGQSSGGFPDGIIPGDVAAVGLFMFSIDVGAVDFPQTHQLRAGIGQHVWATDTVFFADNPGIPGDATGTFAPAAILVIHQFIPEPTSLAMFGIASFVIFRRKRAPLAPAASLRDAGVKKSSTRAGMRHLALSALVVLWLAHTAVHAGQVHVTTFGTGQTGLTWDDAFGDIQDAINAAAINPAIDEGIIGTATVFADVSALAR